jgi:hypothetical protein
MLSTTDHERPLLEEGEVLEFHVKATTDALVISVTGNGTPELELRIAIGEDGTAESYTSRPCAKCKPKAAADALAALAGRFEELREVCWDLASELGG